VVVGEKYHFLRIIKNHSSPVFTTNEFYTL
jgi:hypothetical protein